VFGPAPETLSTGLRTSVDTALAPAREGYGGCAGANDGADRPENQRQPQGSKAATQGLLSVGFSTRSARTEVVCPPRNIPQRRVVQPQQLRPPGSSQHAAVVFRVRLLRSPALDLQSA
jgi:hypothetical protein